MERRKGSSYEISTVACDDGSSCSNSHHFLEGMSEVDGFVGNEHEDSTACQTAEPGQIFKDVEDTGHTEGGRYPDNVVNQDKKLQPAEESRYQNDRTGEEAVDGGVVDLDDCPGLDLADLCQEQCEWPVLKCEELSSHVRRNENGESEPFIDIHSLEQDSGLNQKTNDCLVYRNSPIHSTSPVSGSLLSENHGHELFNCLCSFDMIHSLPESWGHTSTQLDLQSLDMTNPAIRSLSSSCGVYEREDLWTNGDLSLSDSGHIASEISFGLSSERLGLSSERLGLSSERLGLSSERIDVSHQEDIKDVLQKKDKHDSGCLINSLPITCYNSFLKSPEDVEDNSELPARMTNDFNNEATAHQKYFYLKNNLKESRKRNLHNLDTESSNESRRNLFNLVTENSDFYEDQNISHSQNNTVSNSLFSDNNVHHIMFYIIHQTTSQKVIITFHDLEFNQDYPGKTFCSLKSFQLRRGLWLLHHLERLGFLTFHAVTPTIVIVEPALHGLGGYFQQMEHGQQVSVLDSMQYEWMRVRSFWSFPRNAGVSYLHLARVGFFYTGRVSETCCYSCGRTYGEWNEGDDPVEIHRRLSPDCPHLNGREARNRPIYPDINEQWPAIPWEPEGAQVAEEPAALAGAESLDTDPTANLDERSRHSSLEKNIAVETTCDLPSLGTGDDLMSSRAQHREQSRQGIDQDDLSKVKTTAAVLDDTPHNIPEAPSGVGANSVPSAEEGTPSRLTGGSERPDQDRTTQEQDPPGVDPNTQEQAAPRGNQDESVPRGVPRADPQANYMPRYPLYAVRVKRAESFRNGWPAYLNQTAYEMSSAGFFYSGNGDYCRCFYCGGGLRNWEPGDDPWVEHARWFPRCLFVRQNKGERFIRLVLQRQENNQQNAPPRQEPVLQPPPANQPHPPPVERNQLQGQAASQPNQQSQQLGEQANTTTTLQSQQDSTVDEMSIAAVESLKMNGVSSSRIQQALQIWKRQQKQAYKITNVTSAQLMQIIFEQEDEENRRLTETSQFPSALAMHGADSMRGESSHGAGAHFSGITSRDSTGQDPESQEVQSLQKEIEERKKKLMCTVCGENEVTVAFLPCGHLVCCFQCAPAMIKCPNCQEPLKGNVKVFLM